MLISNLQQFIKLLVPPLTAARENNSAETVLEKLAAALEPFKDENRRRPRHNARERSALPPNRRAHRGTVRHKTLRGQPASRQSPSLRK